MTGAFDIWHINDIPWWDAPIPRKWHRCKAQTMGVQNGQLVKRCACGAIYFHGAWMDRNSRRRPRGGKA